jgi:MFS family permease
VLAACIGFALLAAFVPFARAFYRVEVNYNEGWDVYNAALVAAHGQLYPAKAGWTNVNYPMGWLALVAQLHRWTHDYLFTARVLSLLSLCGCCALVAAIVRRLAPGWRPALLAGFFCLALFAVAADFPAYVGMDDPQIPSLVIYLAGLWVVLRWENSRLGLALSALLFVLAFSTKHNPVEFLLAAFFGLLLVSRRRAAWFAFCSAVFLATSLALHLHYGGPSFLRDMLSPRGYSIEKAFVLSGDYLGPLVLPLAIALYTAYGSRKDPRQRVVSLLLFWGLLLGGYFVGGEGVSINSFFGVYLAISILVGLYFARLEVTAPRRAAYAPAVLFGWLLIVPWLVVPPLDERAQAQIDWNPPLALERIAAAQTRFDAEVALLRSQPGPALCESQLRCYFAGKPYIYDPYNATRLIRLGELDPEVIVAALRSQQYGAVQLSGSIDDNGRTEVFAPSILAAIRQYYQPVLDDRDAVIYLPNSALAARRGASAATLVVAANARPPHKNAKTAAARAALRSAAACTAIHFIP